jgi:molybdopterin molybdotransferase
MISVSEAQSVISRFHAPFLSEELSVYEAAGRRLAHDLKASRPYPPFDRVTMDGIAIRHSETIRAWKIVGTQLAGDPPLNLSMADADAAVEIMTGCALPLGADTIIRYEDLQMADDGKSCKLKDDKELVRGVNIHREGSDAAQGSLLLKAGHRLAPCDIPVLLSEGFEKMEVFKSASAGLLITGNELAGVSDSPLPWELRASNHGSMVSSLRESGTDCSVIIAHDEKELLKDALSHLLETQDFVVITGGVSKGKADFLPEVLKETGAEIHFHEVAQRPGKPMLFAVSPQGKPIFALPGNPVSSCLCFYFYVLPYVRSLSQEARAIHSAILSADYSFKPDLDLFLPVEIENSKGQLLAKPLPGNGSGDFLNLVKADGFLWMKSNQKPFRQGMDFPLIMLR